jgi:hypothetical protein
MYILPEQNRVGIIQYVTRMTVAIFHDSFNLSFEAAQQAIEG